MDIRPYRDSDRAACLEVFDSLDGAVGRAEFEAFLKAPDGPYFVMEHEDRVAGCGGFAMAGDGQSARLRWGMIRRDLQRMGLGRFLLLYRMREIGRTGNAAFVVVQTPAGSARFFELQGFRPGAADADRIELVKKLAVCP